MNSTPVVTKPSKSALKKAARQARLEKKQQQRTEARKRQEEERQRSTTPPLTPPEKAVFNGSVDAPQLTSAATVDTLDEATPEAGSKAEPEVAVGLRSEVQQAPTTFTPQASETEVILSSHQTVKHLNKTPSMPQSVVHPEPQREVPQPQGPKSSEQLAAEAGREKKRQNVLQRTIWTLIMIGGFIGWSLTSTARNGILIYV
jgi:phosphatidate cytidylyltransferase